MDNLYFEFTHVTGGHSLNMVKTEPELIKKLKAYCTKHKCRPSGAASAIYDFTYQNGFARTYHQVGIPMVIGKASIATWLKQNPLQWSFGLPQKDYREA